MAHLYNRPLDFARYEIRLLKLLPAFADYDDFPIECEIEHFSLFQPSSANGTRGAERPEYHALSYSWGDIDDTVTIWVNGCEVQVTRSLYQALHELRRRLHIISHEERGALWLWVDALCINQNDLSEKGLQITRMSRIYARASSVLAWLGPDSDTSASAMEALSVIAPYCSSYRPFEYTRAALFSLHHGVSAIPELLQRPYWRRKWIIQEISKATRLGIICGRSEITPLKTFIMPCLASFGHHLAPPEVRDLLISLQHFRHREHPRHREQPPFLTMPRMTLSETLIRSRHSLAQDPRDYVFSLLDLAKDGNDLVQMPNYFQSPKQVFQGLSWNMIALQGQVPLLLLGRASRRTIAKDTSPNCSVASDSDYLQSWSPNWSQLDTHVAPWILDCIAQAQAKCRLVYPAATMDASSNTPEILKLAGIAREKIVAVAGTSVHAQLQALRTDSQSLVLEPDFADRATVEPKQKTAETILEGLWDTLTACAYKTLQGAEYYISSLTTQRKCEALFHLSTNGIAGESTTSLFWSAIQGLFVEHKPVKVWMEEYIGSRDPTAVEGQLDSGYSTPLLGPNTVNDHDVAQLQSIAILPPFSALSSTLSAEHPQIHDAKTRKRSHDEIMLHARSYMPDELDKDIKRRRTTAAGYRNPSTKPLPFQISVEAAVQHLETSLAIMKRHRMRLVVTNQDRFAIVHDRARVGDTVFQLQNCCLPVVVRPTPESLSRDKRWRDRRRQGLEELRPQTVFEIVGEMCLPRKEWLEWPVNDRRSQLIMIV